MQSSSRNGVKCIDPRIDISIRRCINVLVAFRILLPLSPPDTLPPSSIDVSRLGFRFGCRARTNGWSRDESLQVATGENPPLDRSLLPWLGAKNEYYRRINRTRVPSETLPNYSNENGDLKIATLCGLFDFGRENAERSINRVPGYYPGILIYLLTRLLAHPPRGNVGELVKRILIYCELEILRSLQIYRVG